MVEILQKGSSVLRQVAQDVAIEDISTPHIKNIIKRMQQAMDEQDDSVAIAAPQIGEPVRIFIVSGKVFLPNYPDIDVKKGTKIPKDLICINPELVKLSKEKKSLPEGCLSVRWLYGNVRRSTRATVKALDQHGKEFTRGGAGLLAQIFQHENDHLNGILFTDTATDIEDSPPDGKEKIQYEE